MANDLRSLLRSRCSDTLAMEQDLVNLNMQMAQEVQNPQLKDILELHGKWLSTEQKNLQQILNTLGGEQPAEEATGFFSLLGGRFRPPGENLGAEIGDDIVDAHRKFVDHNPKNLVDVNDALLEEEVTHFNLGNYTGLIVLAKQLGEWDIANIIQQNIDNESQIRLQLENTLPVILANISGQGKMAA